MERVVLKEQGVFLMTDAQGDIPAQPGPLGLYYQDTRFLSRFELRLNGLRAPLLDLDDKGYAATLTYGEIAEAGREGSAGPQLPRGVLVTRTHYIGPLEDRGEEVAAGVLHEQVTITNHDRTAHDLTLTVALAADFYDMFKVRGFFDLESGSYDPPALLAPDTFDLRYVGCDDRERHVTCRFAPPPDSIQAAPLAGEGQGVLVTYALALAPRATTTMTMAAVPTVGVLPSEALARVERLAPFDQGLRAAVTAQRAWLDDCTGIALDHPQFNAVVQRSLRDLRLLLENHPSGPYVAAGIPWFAVPFGRDGMVVALEMLMVNPRIAMGTLRYLASRQGQREDPSRDEDPGKIMHEMRAGESVTRGVAPFGPYYGSVDATPLFLVLLGRTLQWTADLDLARELEPAARAALAWLDRYGDGDGDGFVEFQRKAGAGIANQGWKDSGDSLQFPDGTYAEAPIALVEVQGYVYEARVAAATLLRLLGDQQGAADQEARAQALRARFNTEFWLPDEQFFAQALDAAKRPVPAVTSNAGHCMWSGIVDDDKAGAVVERLLAADMCSGWGIRTLSTTYPSYSPLSYHNGSVWPHDVALVVAGLKRYGHDTAAAEVCAQVLAAGVGDNLSRLPELYGGLPRAEDGHRPVPYPVSCSPQAWSAASALLFVQSLLGLQVDAAAGTITLRPTFPTGLTRVNLRRLRVGTSRVDLEVTVSAGTYTVTLAGGGPTPRTGSRPSGETLTLPLA